MKTFKKFIFHKKSRNKSAFLKIQLQYVLKVKKNSGEKFLATIRTKRKADCCRSWFSVPEASSVLTQVCCRAPAETFLVREHPMKRSRVPKIRQRLKLQLTTSSPFVIALTFHSTACFGKKDEPYPVIIIVDISW